MPRNGGLGACNWLDFQQRDWDTSPTTKYLTVNLCCLQDAQQKVWDRDGGNCLQCQVTQGPGGPDTELPKQKECAFDPPRSHVTGNACATWSSWGTPESNITGQL